MLKEVLEEIKNSNYISKQSIATKLSTSENLIEDVFFQLDRMGYIKEDVMGTCEIECGSCPYASSCNQSPVKSYLITEKGEKLLDK